MRPLPPPWRWREAGPQDQAFLDAMFLAGRPHLQALGAAGAQGAAVVRMQQQVHEAGLRQAYPQARCWIALREAEPLACAVVDLSQAELRLLDLVVHPAARRAGIARTIVTHLQREALARGLGMGLTVAASNTAARGLYLALGFRVVEDRDVVQRLAWHGEPAA